MSSWPLAPTGSRKATRPGAALLAEPDQEADRLSGETEPESGPSRRCIVTRAVLPKAAMLRFVVAPDAALVFDAAATLPGRGLWLSAGRDVIEEAVKRGAFAKAAKQRVAVAEGLADRIEASLERRIVELLGLTRRSGAARAGFEKVREMLAARGCAALIEASDGSVAERARLLNGRDVPSFTPLTAARLGAVFGREALMHVGLAPGRLAGMIAIEAARLAGARGETMPPLIANAGKSGHRDAAG